jgi:hypothetical protein
MAMPPNLHRRLSEVRAAVRELPGVAAAQLGDLVDQAHEEQRAPDGTAWKPVLTRREARGAKYDARVGRFRVRGRFAPGRGPGRSFDPQHHIQYRPVVRGDKAMLESDHPAAGYSRWGTRKMEARPQVPGRNAGLGWWLEPLILALRGRLARRS